MRAPLAALALALVGCNQVFGVEPPVPRRADAGPALSEVQPQCLLPSDCAPDETCLFQHCSPPCAQDRDCPEQAACLQTGSGKAACVRLADNRCGEREACPDGTRCVSGRCASLCDAAGAGTCLLGRACQDGVCVLASAPPDAGAALLPDATQQPMAAGTSGERPPPPAAGASGAPAATECRSGEERCQDGAAQSCGTDGRWLAALPCAHQTCIGGRCLGSCAPGEERCASAGIERCDETGHFAPSRACPGQACVNAACVGSCAPGQQRCDTGTSYSTCTAEGSWAAPSECAGAACSGGQCTGSCTPDATRCQPGAQRVQHCTAQGIWQDGMACVDQACVNGACSGECAPGARVCSAGGVRVCSDQGSLSAPAACTDQACINGYCTGVCAPGATRCNAAGQLETCSAVGVWGDARACSGQACVNGACSGVCAPAARRCSAGNRLELCSASGEWQLLQQCSAPGEICKDSSCAANPPVSLGYADVRGWSTGALLNNRLYLLGPFDAGFAADVLAINLIGGAANGATADMFIYQDDAGRPGRFRARASSTLLLTSGNASSDVRPVGSQIPLGAKVWIGAVFFGDPQLPRPTVTSFPTDAYVYAFTFGAAPPDPFPVASAQLVMGAALPFFLTLRELPP